ncbi:hypothetical protein [Prauserella cavernicola]|uniref:Uncharacterized protein n=1 Tax=Prauserella cavernicola TaxID=2800127 RepID=A0A934V9L6_9PSEU|nr:hypothetical protein [Prauserella cavernicola]MBK1788968.1 hypothetical protein [Prauserella cavernicola]
MPQLSWKVLGVAAVTGILVVLGCWWAGPSLFGAVETEQSRTVEATVTLPADCTAPDAEETVSFELDGETRNGTLNGCGHDQDEQIEIAVPSEAPDGLIDVQLANAAMGSSDLRRPVGLALLVVSCAAGGSYAFLVVRGPRRLPAVL